VGLTGARFDWRRARLVRPRDEGVTGRAAIDCIGGNQLPVYLVEAVRSVGTFSSDLFFGFDDLEFGLRLRRAGYRMYTPGSDWLGRRSREPVGLGRVTVGLGTLDWRRYYSLRNMIHILRLFGRSAAAARVTIVQGLVKPLVNLPRSPRLASGHLRLNLAACRDGWTGRLGRTLEPDV
jgi:hypothetical protein